MFEFRRWVRGYVRVNLRGTYPERFINICNSRNIELRKLVYYKDHYNCNISLDDYRKLRPPARKTGVVPYIESRHGFPFFIAHLRRRKSFVIGMALCIVIFFLLSSYIWRVDIEGNYRHSTDQLMQYMNSLGVGVGVRISKIDAAGLESSIRKEYPDIGWVSVQIRGTCMNVSIKEINTSYETLGVREIDYEYAHIVATRDGIVSGIVTRSGEPLVKEGDEVEKGQILVSGVITVVGDNDVIIDKKPVRADADITIESCVSVAFEIDRSYIHREYTGRSRTGYNIFLFSDKIFSYNSGIPYAKCDIISGVKNFEVFKNFYLPIKYEQFTVREFNEVEMQYTDDELEELMGERLERILQELRENGCGIIDVSMEKAIKRGALSAKGQIMVDASFVKYKEVSDDEWRMNLTDEYKRENN